MEPLFLLLVSTLLSTQAWAHLGFNNDRRTSGVITAVLAAALFATATVDGLSSPVLISPDNALVVTAVRAYILLWAAYSAVLAANGLWGYGLRALGLHAAFIGIASIFIAVLPLGFPTSEVSGDAHLILSIGSLTLAAVSAAIFLYLGVPLRHLRSVTGWLLLAGASITGVLGMAVFFGVFHTVT